MIYPIPFPLSSGRYEVAPAMRRFGTAAGQGLPAEEAHFLPDDDLARTLAAKLAVLRKAPDESHLLAPGLDAGAEAGLRAAILESFRLLATEQPALATVTDDGVTLHHLGLRVTGWTAPTPGVAAVGEPWPELVAVAREIRAWLAERQGIRRLGDALGLAVQEDLAIVRGPGPGAGGAARAAEANQADNPDQAHEAACPDLLEWLHVCLPSNWAPAEKIGGSFISVHEPVVHNERLLASHAQIIRAMIHAGPFARYVWALHRDAELCHNPRLHKAPPWLPDGTLADLAGQACFRVERQTTHGFPGLNRALFTIRYWVEPLAETVADPWRRERLASALQGMDEAALAYKGLSSARDRLVMWLERRRG